MNEYSFVECEKATTYGTFGHRQENQIVTKVEEVCLESCIFIKETDLDPKSNKLFVGNYYARFHFDTSGYPFLNIENYTYFPIEFFNLKATRNHRITKLDDSQDHFNFTIGQREVKLKVANCEPERTCHVISVPSHHVNKTIARLVTLQSRILPHSYSKDYVSDRDIYNPQYRDIYNPQYKV